MLFRVVDDCMCFIGYSSIISRSRICLSAQSHSSSFIVHYTSKRFEPQNSRRSVTINRRRVIGMASGEGNVPSAEEYSKRWEIMWNGGNDNFEVKNGDGGILKPGQSFDAGKSAPHLTDFLQNKGLGDDIDEKTVLIPGCGRGYDVVSFVKYGAKDVTGLEIAPTAVASAKVLLDTELKGNSRTKARVIPGDFFSPSDDAKYDIGYDYTFFCAIHPTMREGWAQSWSKHIKPGGILVTSIFPDFEDRSITGPPWPVWPDLYKEVLGNAGFTLRSLEKVDESKSHPGRGGKEWLAVWDKISKF